MAMLETRVRSGRKESTHQADEFWRYGVREDFFPPEKGKLLHIFRQRTETIKTGFKDKAQIVQLL